MKKLISVLIAVIMLCSAFTACSDKDVSQGTAKKIITVNGKIMSNAVYDYYVFTEEINNPDASSEEREAAALKQTARHVFVDELCREKGITFDNEAKTNLNSQLDALIAQYGSKDALVEEISKFGLDYDTYYALMESSYLENILKTEIIKSYTDEQRQEFYNNNMINVQHILFTTVDENQNPLDEAVAQDKKALAEDVLKQIKDGADFKEMVKRYNEDSGLTTDGYMVCRYTSFVKPFLDAALALDVDEVSPLIETSYGYHIIKRYEHKGNNIWYQNSKDAINDALFEQQFDNWYKDADIVVK